MLINFFLIKYYIKNSEGLISKYKRSADNLYTRLCALMIYIETNAGCDAYFDNVRLETLEVSFLSFKIYNGFISDHSQGQCNVFSHLLLIPGP